ncbi:MAG: AAA family ATPase [Actinomycetota bacterium]|nr:AAA family ATPase [Actinomycetota bacterium]
MKIAITGKGGVGKTTVAAALACTYARRGHAVVALDADPNPNLGIALGMDPDETDHFASVANALVREGAAHHHDSGAFQAPEREAEQLLGDLGVEAPDGIRLIQTGRIESSTDGCLCCGSHRATRRLFDELSGHDRVIVADLEAGVTDLCWTDPKPEDTVVIVATTDRSSLEIARRARQVTSDLGVGRVLVVANRVRGPEDSDEVREFMAGSELVWVPEDPAVSEAERSGTSLLDLAGVSPASAALGSLATRMLPS